MFLLRFVYSESKIGRYARSLFISASMKVRNAPVAHLLYRLPRPDSEVFSSIRAAFWASGTLARSVPKGEVDGDEDLLGYSEFHETGAIEAVRRARPLNQPMEGCPRLGRRGH
jgi:hypothetical protein